jgi:alpha-mannosidase
VPDELAPALEGAVHQTIEDVSGDSLLLLGEVTLPPLATSVIPLSGASAAAPSPFRVKRNGVETPFARVRLNARGEIVSLIDKAAGREVIGREGGNVFLLGEDIPAAWDNWDIDADQAAKMEPVATLESRETVADGPLQLRLRSTYRLTDTSSITQDMVFHATTPRIDFETRVDWHEKRQLLKVAFDLQVLAGIARHEIQYGHVERPTHRNLPQDRARFEVCAHKWTDLSENGFGVALLNDCKYGVSVHGSWIWLSLIKSGVHPDDRGDEGVHLFTYSLLPHVGGFSVPSVVRPAYELNVPVSWSLAGEGAHAIEAPVAIDSANVIIECLKWAEEGDAFIIRLYDAGKIGSHVRLRFSVPVKSVTETNILEEDLAAVPLTGQEAPSVTVYVRPFEIKTLRCRV